MPHDCSSGLRKLKRAVPLWGVDRASKTAVKQSEKDESPRRHAGCSHTERTGNDFWWMALGNCFCLMTSEIRDVFTKFSSTAGTMWMWQNWPFVVPSGSSFIKFSPFSRLFSTRYCRGTLNKNKSSSTPRLCAIWWRGFSAKPLNLSALCFLGWTQSCLWFRSIKEPVASQGEVVMETKRRRLHAQVMVCLRS